MTRTLKNVQWGALAGLVVLAVVLGLLFAQFRTPSGTGQPRPDPHMTTLSGEPVTLERFRGQVVLLDVWATWCSPCVAALPRLEALHNRYEGRGFVVVGISLDEGGAKTVRPLLARRSLTYPMLLDTTGPDSARRVFNVEIVPTQILLDGSGQLIGRWSAPADETQVEAAIINALTLEKSR